MYTQGLHRREFEVGYTHRRERALQEGEGASIELARQMQAQVKVDRTDPRTASFAASSVSWLLDRSARFAFSEIFIPCEKFV